MKIMVIGSGGREHALIWKFKQSEKVDEIFCANGNAGIARLARCVDIEPTEINKLADFARDNKIDLTFAGGETSLALGVVDEFEKHNLKIIGVSKKAAQLESSKSFAKDFMMRYKIPTAAYKTAHSVAEAKEILQSGILGDKNSPIVIKADGLAAGKGVVVAENRLEGEKSVEELDETVGKHAAQKFVLEECLFGREVSLLMFANGKDFALMPPVRDYKRIGNNDSGANTGGMGTISGSNLLTAAQTEEIIETIIKPTLTGAENEGFPLRGILFLGLMMTETGAKVLEYNVRLGDPETQAILVRLETDLVEICQAIYANRISDLNIKWKKGNSACVVLAAAGYPQKPRKGDLIKGLKEAEEFEDVQIFHAGTALDANRNLITNGGRILSVTANGQNLEQALEKTYRAVEKISWYEMQFRRDIGR